MLWQKAQRLTLILVDAFYSRNECCCNPSVGLKRGSHICVPLRQLAMCFHRLSMVPFAPTTITEELLTQILTPRLPRAQRFLLEQLLTNRQFTALWQEEGVLAILRGTCIFCGAGHTPPDLILHLREEHSCQHIMFHFYAAQLIDVVHDLQPDIFQCSMCTQIFNLPWTLKPDEPAAARLDLAQSHLKGHCPVLTQLALLFSALLHGHHNLYANHGSGGGGAGDRGIFSTGPTLPRQFPEAGTQPEGHQATQKRNARSDRKTSTASRSRSARGTAGDATGTHHGQLDHQARSGTSKSAQNGSIHSFLSSEPLGALHLLVQESKIWKQKMEASTPHMLSLRQHLTITLLKALRQRAEQIVQAKDTEELYLTSVQKGLILKDRSFPFHKWDHAEKKLVLDKKTPISAAKMGQHLEELLEMLQDPYLVIRFHSLKPHSQDLQSVPWRLQLNLRSDRPYELFLHLAHSSLWMLVGASMKPHSLGQSGLATAVQSLMNGKGKGKGKRAKQELTP